MGTRKCGGIRQCLSSRTCDHRTEYGGPTVCFHPWKCTGRCGLCCRQQRRAEERYFVRPSTELKNVILFDHVQVPHYNYVGDSVLGYYSHMGAGSITSNVKSDKTLVVVKGSGEYGDIEIETGLKKFGAMLGDHVEVGCNSVLNPGSVIGRYTNIYPLSPIRGYIPESSIVKTGNVIVTKRPEV